MFYSRRKVSYVWVSTVVRAVDIAMGTVKSPESRQMAVKAGLGSLTCSSVRQIAAYG